ncbi:type II secretion system protein N [Exilibacterium tricleocarpae]|uniref:Type II secretion system protein N n=1 Tax=Exilibacterium tricleocarpae TaxID=2591008 RepID=A0A545TZ60_9GAMM|nr:type II secretion system protein N [Exilibacterium tricleocarpae]TQV82506.1 type II secretion system protein N [Exilibacterium tricleocarpae]
MTDTATGADADEKRLRQLPIKRAHWIIAAVLLWLGMVLTSIPAAWGAWLLQSLTPLQMGQVSGSFWSGRAASAAVQIEGQVLPLGTLRWQFRPLSLLWLQPCVDFETALQRQKLSGRGCGGPAGWRLADGEFNGAAALLSLWWQELQLDGDLSVQIQSAKGDGPNLGAIDGNINWRGARFQYGRTWMSLGSFAAKLKEDGEGGVNAEVFDLDGPIELRLQVNARETLSFSGTIKPREGAPAPLFQALPMIGERGADGGYAVSWSF